MGLAISVTPDTARWLNRKLGHGFQCVVSSDGIYTLPNPADQVLATLLETDEVADAPQHKKARGIPALSRKLNPTNGKNWLWSEDILAATTLTGRPLERFSWNPVTGEFLFIYPGQQHASARGQFPFDDYVRGLVFPDRHLVTLRPVVPTWTDKLSMEEIRDFSFDAQSRTRDVLKSHGGAKGWTFQFNINNKDLEAMTGRSRW